MKQVMNVLLLAVLVFAGCKKDKNDDNPPNTLPGQINLKEVSLSSDKKSFKAGNITFKGSNGYIDRTWQNCIEPDGAEIRKASNGGIELAYTDFNTLIADVNSLPAINKVTVRFFNNCCPTLSACDANGVIATTTAASNSGDNATITLDLGGKKATKVSFQSMESILYSLTIE